MAGELGEARHLADIEDDIDRTGKPRSFQLPGWSAYLDVRVKRGTIAVFGGRPQLLPTFRLDCVYDPVFLRLYLRYLRDADFPILDEHIQGSYRRYSGDLVALGKG